MALNSRELNRQLQKLRKSLKNFPKQPTVEEVHDLRTRSRRVESILEALEMNSGNEKKILRHLKSIRRRAGKVRDMDVFTLYIVGLGANEDGSCIVRLVHHLGLERRRHDRKLYSLVQRDAGDLRRRLRRAQLQLRSLVQRFVRSIANLNRKQKAKTEEPPLHAVSVALRLFEELAAVRHLGANNLHSYRIEVKRLRYILEMAEDDAGEQHQFIEELKEVQDAIGEWHDWLELANIAHRVLTHGNGCRAIQKIEQTTRKKFTQALHTTQQMQQRYLAAPGAGRKGKSVTPGAEPRLPIPALAATSHLVS